MSSPRGFLPNGGIKRGARPAVVQPVYVFPHVSHVECVMRDNIMNVVLDHSFTIHPNKATIRVESALPALHYIIGNQGRSKSLSERLSLIM